MNLADVTREYRQVPLDLVDEPVLPSRSAMDDQKLDELTESIRAVGILQPVTLARRGDRHEVVAGHRRTLAAKRIGLAFVPAIVYPSVDVALEAIKFAENAFREDLSPADEAIWFTQLLERDCGGDTDRLAALLHLKRDRVERRLALVLGDPRVFEALQRQAITVGVAEQLNRCNNGDHRRMLLDLAVRNGATVALVTGWINEWKTIHEPTRGATPAPGASDGPAPMPPIDPFRCQLCGLNKHPASIRPLQVHDYCIASELEPALEMWRRRSEFVRVRTFEDAVEAVSDLTDRFPQLAGEQA